MDAKFWPQKLGNVLPAQVVLRPKPCPSILRSAAILLLTLILALTLLSSRFGRLDNSRTFYHNVKAVQDVCIDVINRTASYAGHLGLDGDSDKTPKRSFFWYFEAEEEPNSAPLILTIGGGPGTSAMMNALWGQSPCLASESGLVPNPNRWTQRHNLIALDHPVGVGFSYGTQVNNSRSAAYDVYDFLQKFFILFPHLAKNKFVVSGGSYGGIYVPNIATVIHEQNLLLANGGGNLGAVHIHLDALILSNPLTNPMSHFSWFLHYRCVDHALYNTTQCETHYAELPVCLESIQMAFDVPTLANRLVSQELCWKLQDDLHGINQEDIRRTCNEDPDDPIGCHKEFTWVKSILDDDTVRRGLGIAHNLTFTSLNLDVNAKFGANGDVLRPHHLMYPPLLEAGIRLLHYVGTEDANCAWPGVFSFLKLLSTPFQQAFLTAPDVPWPNGTKDVATVRTVGEGAGNMAFILVREAGHFTVKDQPALAKKIVEHWIANEPFF
ncbi:alpha/beta-hydrolase [Mycena metata]|uniref:carboxypeptidase C n=1 Tax=Mycena metata TaxID=1033252 RepID=A0AAD7HWX0_9AGAR|nr:alpha/beta-hydrolase [Mycena metata]